MNKKPNKEDASSDWAGVREQGIKKMKKLLRRKKHGWWFDKETNCLIFQINEDTSCDVPLEMLKTSWGLSNFIFHLLEKTFIKPKDMYQFLEAVNLLLLPNYNPIYSESRNKTN